MALDDAYDLAYRAAVRALDHQLAAVTELRGRANLLLAASSLTLPLLGHRALAAQPFGSLAIGCFLLLSASVLTIVWPHTGWCFDSDPNAMLAAHLSSDETTATALCVSLIAHMADDRRANARNLARVTIAFRVGACLLVIQMLSSVIAASIGG
jgi:hypothetical protein